MKPRIFISHSSKDAELVTELVGLLRSSLNLPGDSVRATSSDGHRLPGGAQADAHLLNELLDCDVLLGVLSPASLTSQYVVFELGARWGTRKRLIPLLAPGLPTSSLEGPLKNLNALRLDAEGELHQLVTEVARVLGREAEPASVYLKEIRRLMTFGRVIAPPSKAAQSEPITSSEDPTRLHLSARVLSHYFSTEPDEETCILHETRVLVSAGKLDSVRDLLGILEEVINSGSSLLVYADEIAGDVLPTLIVNKQRHTLSVCAIAAAPARREAERRQLAKFTGATVFNDEAGRSLWGARIDELGRAAKVTAMQNATIIERTTDH